jgi:hypothetical protein
MSFKHFYYRNITDKSIIFESVFETYYEKGYFGKLDKDVIKSQQKSWFDKLIMLLDEGDQDFLFNVLQNRDNITRQWVSRIYNEDITESSRQEIKDFLEKVIK